MSPQSCPWDGSTCTAGWAGLGSVELDRNFPPFDGLGRGFQIFRSQRKPSFVIYLVSQVLFKLLAEYSSNKILG